MAQELALVPQLTVAQNVFLGIEPRHASVIDRGALTTRFEALRDAAGFDLPSNARVGSLRIGQRQQVEILRALARDADLIVLDEPTAALAATESERLHEIIRGLAAQGRTVVLVSHFLGEVLALADTISVLRDGAGGAHYDRGSGDRGEPHRRHARPGRRDCLSAPTRGGV